VADEAGPLGRGLPQPLAEHPKRPRDPDQLAKVIVKLATGDAGAETGRAAE
jgi:hypothetical protein